MKKVVVIETCFSCPHHDHRWTDPPWCCDETGRQTRSENGSIPRWCPLEGVKEFVKNQKEKP